MSRSHRSQVAQETVAICETGRYTSPSGRTVEIDHAIRESVSNTILYTEDNSIEPAIGTSSTETKLTVANETTVAALRHMYRETERHLACLNFASAKNPGGGFLGGSEAQEESLARSSALYPCLLAAPEYYDRNRACRSALYLDEAIWSPNVPFFRDDSGILLDVPFYGSVITSPAPNAGAVAANEPTRSREVAPVLQHRAKLVLGIAAAHGVRRLILGAWGCGVFRNDPKVVAHAFAALIRSPGDFSAVFDEVVFAIYDRSKDQSVIRIFREALA
jgi:uncharacterized protein (TIGR02452 family)